jgi:hypothetical protein
MGIGNLSFANKIQYFIARVDPMRFELTGTNECQRSNF